MSPRSRKRARAENLALTNSSASTRPRRRNAAAQPLPLPPPPTQLDVPLPDWASRPLALPTPFEVDEFFRNNEDTRWAVREFERRDLEGLFGPFDSAYPRISRLFYQNMVVVEAEPDKLSTVIDGVTVTVTPRDIAAALHCTRVVSGYAPFPDGVTFDEIVGDMCEGRYGRRQSHTRRAFLPARIWFVDSVLKANVCVSGHHEERNGTILEALYAFHKGYEVSIPDLIWREMLKFYEASKVRQTPSALARALPFPTVITTLVRQYYDIPSYEDEACNFKYFDQSRWETSFRTLQPSAGLPPPPPPPAPVVDPIPSLAPASIDALRTELLAAIRSEIAAAPPPPALLTEIAGIRSELSELAAAPPPPALLTEIADMRTEIADMRTEIADMRTEIADMRTEIADMRTEIADMRTEIADMRTELAAFRTQLAALVELHEREMSLALSLLRELRDRR